MATYYVYIMASRAGTLYTGMTRNLEQRVHRHKCGQGSVFTKKHRIGRLVYFEACPDVRAAIAREKKIKGWRREKKTALIESVNPRWEDLSADWYARTGPA